MDGVHISTSIYIAVRNNSMSWLATLASCKVGAQSEPRNTRVPPLQRQAKISQAAVQVSEIRNREAQVLTHVKADVEDLTDFDSWPDSKIAR